MAPLVGGRGSAMSRLSGSVGTVRLDPAEHEWFGAPLSECVLGGLPQNRRGKRPWRSLGEILAILKEMRPGRRLGWECRLPRGSASALYRFPGPACMPAA